MNRPTKDEYYLDIALAVSKRSPCLKLHYGAVIVNNDVIVSTGYNGSPRGEFNCCDVGECKRKNIPHNTGNYAECESVHAEQNAMIAASLDELRGATLYLMCEEMIDGVSIIKEDYKPCPICSRMIKNSQIARVVTKKESWYV